MSSLSGTAPSLPRLAFHEGESPLDFPNSHPPPPGSLLLGAPSLYALAGPTSDISMFCTVLTLLYDWSPSLGGCLCQGLLGCEKLKPTTMNPSNREGPSVHSPERKPEPCLLWDWDRTGRSSQQETFNSPPSVFLWGGMWMSPVSRASSYLQRIHSACCRAGLSSDCPPAVTSTCDATHLASLVPGFDRLDLQAHRLAFLRERIPGTHCGSQARCPALSSPLCGERRGVLRTHWSGERRKGGLVWKGAWVYLCLCRSGAL